MSRLLTLSSALIALSLAAAPCAFADTVTYATITASTGSVVTGTVDGVGFTITGTTAFVQFSNTGATNYFTDSSKTGPGSVYVGGNIGNAPTDGALVALSLPNQTYTIAFDAPVSGLVFSEVSLGPAGGDVTYSFDQDFVVETCGTGYWGGGCFDNQPVGTIGSVLAGNEASGSVEFNTPMTSLTFTVGPNSEYWNGFDIGLLPQVATTPAVPEPSSLALLGTGIFGLVGVARRKLRS
jgi:hypothetical protein